MLHRSILLAALPALAVVWGAAAQDAPPTPPSGAAPAQEAKPAPRIAVEPPTLDLGRMLDDKSVHGAITVRNDGDSDLVITGVSSTCGCTIPTFAGAKMDTGKKQAETTKVTLKPGETAAVDVEFHPGGKHDKQVQKITFKSNDPAQRELVVEVHATVQPIVQTDPAIVGFGEVERNQPKTVVATITGRTPDFAVPMVTTGSEFITAKVLDTTDHEDDGVKTRQVRIQFTLLAPKAMPIAGSATIRTNDPRRRIVSLPMQGTVLGDLALDPPILAVGLALPGDSVEKSIRIRSRTGKPFRILDVKERGLNISPATWSLVEAGPDAPGAFDLALTFAAPRKPGIWKGTLVLTTDVPDQEKIEVPYNGSIRPVPAPAEPTAKPPAAPGQSPR
jgi:hypothetical protein